MPKRPAPPPVEHQDRVIKGILRADRIWAGLPDKTLQRITREARKQNTHGVSFYVQERAAAETAWKRLERDPSWARREDPERLTALLRAMKRQAPSRRQRHAAQAGPPCKGDVRAVLRAYRAQDAKTRQKRTTLVDANLPK